MLVSIVNKPTEEPEWHPGPYTAAAIGIIDLVVGIELAGQCLFKIHFTDCIIQSTNIQSVKLEYDLTGTLKNIAISCYYLIRLS